MDEDDGRTERVLSVNGIEKGQGNDECLAYYEHINLHVEIYFAVFSDHWYDG